MDVDSRIRNVLRTRTVADRPVTIGDRAATCHVHDHLIRA